LIDGDFQKASFNRPQGLVLDGESLYVADTENHSVRRVDLKRKRRNRFRQRQTDAAWKSTGGAAKTSELSSPWDLAKIGDALLLRWLARTRFGN
jgi:hypothetical protein